jgi:hypothetical protein
MMFPFNPPKHHSDHASLTPHTESASIQFLINQRSRLQAIVDRMKFLIVHSTNEYSLLREQDGSGLLALQRHTQGSPTCLDFEADLLHYLRNWDFDDLGLLHLHLSKLTFC